MEETPEGLRDVADKVAQGKTPEITLRKLLSFFGQARRGSVVNRRISGAMTELGLATVPDYLQTYLDDRLKVVRADTLAVIVDQPVVGEEPTDSAVGAPRPTMDFRVRRFLTEDKLNAGLVSIAPDATLEKAVHLMLYTDFSQLPVMLNDKNVQGLITWRTIGRAFALGSQPSTVRDCMEAHAEVNEDDPMATLIERVRQCDAVLVRNKDRKYVTLFTAADLGDMYRDLSESFILLGETEVLLRQLLSRAKFSVEELQASCHPDDERKVTLIEELTFGSYVQLVGDQANWPRLGLSIDRASFVAQLDEIRVLRNAVTHFDPDGLTEEDMGKLRRFCAFLRQLGRYLPG